MAGRRFPNKEKLHVPRITCGTYPSLSLYITSWGFSYGWCLEPNNCLNMALAVKQLYITDSRGGKRLVTVRQKAWKADLRSSFCCFDPVCFYSVWTVLWWHNVTLNLWQEWEISMRIFCRCEFVPFSGPNKVRFFPKCFVKSLTASHKRGVRPCEVQTSNVDSLNMIFTRETDWIHLTQGSFLPCWCTLSDLTCVSFPISWFTI